MSCLAQKIASVLVALWLPLCCCQVMALTSDEGGCCATTTCDSDDHACCCSSEEEGAPQDPAPTHRCLHCVDKGLPPAPISLDSFFLTLEIPQIVCLPPNFFEQALVLATEIKGDWNDSPPESPPASPVSALVRCSQLSLWLI